MARGWESKSVEEQQAEATASKSAAKPRLTPEQAAQQRERETLHLSRQRILQQLQASCNPRHRQMLEAALADLDARMAALK